MAEEYTTHETTRETSQAPHTTVIHEKSSSSGTGIVMAVIVLVAVIGGIYLFSQTSSSEAAKDNAIANAANSVGNAAEQVGDAAETAAGNAANQ
ncbi:MULTISPECIES: hypothetical protein [unclassified Novosphingobium]|uniref:hypothetical protein n=1 Tax=unclassified Novosphingobium TaxID=2644732 RepID=UPI0003150950|nr:MULTISPECIES: hypothetical protein [unclassified Novosphingobium]BBA73907.1 hypothetical protein [Novosphingobium sp. PY1]GFM31144.1 uncharacterized protein PY1_contig_16_85 [Novosphingobium sp. PY1]